MLSCQVVMNALERIAPRHLAEDWDNTGLLVGSFSQKVERILVALDVDDTVVAEAIERRADMIVAHHPAIFRGMKHLRTDLPLGRRLAALLTHGIAAAAAHTNLDITRGGVNDVLAERLGLEKLSTFITNEQEGGDAESLGRIGALPAPVSIEDFAHTVRERLGVSHVRLVPRVPCGAWPLSAVRAQSSSTRQCGAAQMSTSRGMSNTTRRSAPPSRACTSSTRGISARSVPSSPSSPASCARSLRQSTAQRRFL